MKRFIHNFGQAAREFKPRSSYWRRYLTTQNLKLDELKNNLEKGPGLKEFLVVGKDLPVIKQTDLIPYLKPDEYSGQGRKVFFEVYGCQMNVNDTEVVWSILNDNKYIKCDDVKEADVILVVTCAVREGAEQKIWNRLKHLNAMKRNRSKRKGPLQVGVLGCMAERLKTQLLEKEQWVDVIAGPDSYKDLPRLLAITKSGPSAVNVLLSLDETYADIMPVRLNQDAVTSFVSIMRGCDNMCSYCIVPFTRGRERSRQISSIENEVRALSEKGIKEITLLGQNVNSYRDLSTQSEATSRETKLAPGFRTVYKTKVGGVRFAELLERMATIAPNVRFRFTSPHPKDFPDELLQVIRNNKNICKSIHLPAQSGSSTVLERMRRGYTREAYLDLVKNIRDLIPNICLSSDFICGFCGETDEEFKDTISLIRQVKYNVAYLFAYSMREKTTAHRRYKDDVAKDVKIERLKEMVVAYREGAEELHRKFIGEKQLILIEGKSKRSEQELYGRNDGNIKVIIPSMNLPLHPGSGETKSIEVGDFIAVRINETNSQVLKGEPLYHSSLVEFEP